jgi:ornithine carbamoyltransferase
MTVHFIDVSSYSKAVLRDILAVATQFKSDRNHAQNQLSLQGKSVGLIFEKPSTRTRISFEVGIHQLGGQAITLHNHEIGLGNREPIKDVARVISRYMDMVVIRTFNHSDIMTFASYATIPVINALTDGSHPCQAMADFQTIQAHFDDLTQIKIAYLGDGNNVCRSLVEMAHILGVEIVIANPPHHKLETTVPVTRVDNPKEAVKGAHVIYTDTWVSMGEENTQKSVSQFEPYQVNTALMALADPSAIFMHCLPAHRGEEVTDEVIESSQSKVFDQAENRLHVQKAIMSYLLDA